MCTIKWQSYNIWFLRYEVWQTNILSFWAIFYPFTPLTIQKIKILKKWKKTPGDITILHRCTKNHDHMLYYSWDIAHDRWTQSLMLSLILTFPKHMKSNFFNYIKNTNFCILKFCQDIFGCGTEPSSTKNWSFLGKMAGKDGQVKFCYISISCLKIEIRYFFDKSIYFL